MLAESRNMNSRSITAKGRERWMVLGTTLVVALGVCAASVRANDKMNGIRFEGVGGANHAPMFVGDEFIVVLTGDARRDVTTGVDDAGRPVVSNQALQDAIDGNGVIRFARQFPAAKPQPVNGKFRDLTGYYKVRLAPVVNLDNAMAAFARNPQVDHVEKIGIHPIHGCATGTPLTPNDTWFDNPPPTFNWPQWDLWDANGIDADLAWDVATGDSSVVVVGMDSGVRYFHGDLGGPNPPGPADNSTNGNIWVNPFEIPNNGIDDEGNGKVDDVVGWDFVTGVTGCSLGEDCGVADNDPRDFNGHGTHTAGTMAAITNNAAGVAGVAGGFGDGTSGSAGNGSKIMCMRIGWSTPFGGFVRMDFAAQAMAYVTDMKNRGVNVAAVNASWGSSNSGGIDAAVDNLLAADIMLIHAAGNSNANSPGFLGNKAGVMNVAATDKNGNKASFSNFGSWVDIAAPGVEIISTYHSSSDPANDYVAVMDGTSMSAPHAVGVAALLESCDPGLSRTDKFNIMVNNTCPAGSSQIGGILNARLALDAVPGGCGGCTGDADCDDADACNGLETCDIPTGTCQSGTPVDCDDLDDCTTDSCDPETGLCSNDPIDCDDANECTSDSCVAGSCQNTPLADDTVCSIGVCCGSLCTIPVCSLDTDCDDANVCTTDVCNNAGSCAASCSNDPISCPPGETCVNGVCEPQVCNNDGTCDPGEDCNNCSNDCLSGSGANCGNGLCEAGDGEDCVSCPADCNGKQNGRPSGRYCCGDGDGQNPLTCSDSLCSTGGWSCTDTPAIPSCCGDGICEGTEDSFNCEVDCGAPPVCGDAVCDAGEDQCNCPADCGSPPPNEVPDSTCTDGVDNDCDGFTDCDDTDCDTEDPACVCGAKGDPCSNNADCCSNTCKRNGTCR